MNEGVTPDSDLVGYTYSSVKNSPVMTADALKESFLCRCQKDGYYYVASVVHRAFNQFRVTYENYKSSFDETFTLEEACGSFLPFTLENFKYIKLYTEKRLESLVAKGVMPITIVSNDINICKYLYRIDESMKAKDVKYPPRITIMELFHHLEIATRACANLEELTIEAFLSDFEKKFFGKFMHRENEYPGLFEYYNSILNDRKLPSLNEDEMKVLKRGVWIKEYQNGMICRNFGVVHLVRYIHHVVNSHKNPLDPSLSQLNKEKLSLVVEMAAFIKQNQFKYYGRDDYK